MLGVALSDNVKKKMASGKVRGPKLQPRTITTRRKSSSVPLVDTGRLMNSIDYKVMGIRRVIIGTSVFYGKFHQFGTKNIPKREFIFLDDSDKRKIYAITRWVTR